MNDGNATIDAEKVRELAKLRVVLSVPGMSEVEVRRDIRYREESGQEFCIDVYTPPSAGNALPAVLFVAGYSDRGAIELLGFNLREWGCYVSWGQLVAASGFVGITCSCASPPEDMRQILNFVLEHADELHVDPGRVGIWAASGNGPTALSLLIDEATRLRFAVMCNTYMFDSDSDTSVADMAAQFGFAAPNAGKSVRDLASDVQFFVVRSGRDEAPGLNSSLDRFVENAISRNLQLNFVNLPEAPHGFDALHDTDESRATIRQILSFMHQATA